MLFLQALLVLCLMEGRSQKVHFLDRLVRISAVLSINLSTLSMVSIFFLSQVVKESPLLQIFLSTSSSVPAHQSLLIASHWFTLLWDHILDRFVLIVELKTSSMVISVSPNVLQEPMPSLIKMEELPVGLVLVS